MYISQTAEKEALALLGQIHPALGELVREPIRFLCNGPNGTMDTSEDKVMVYVIFLSLITQKNILLINCKSVHIIITSTISSCSINCFDIRSE